MSRAVLAFGRHFHDGSSYLLFPLYVRLRIISVF